MNKVRREDILDYVTYEEQRSTILASAMAAKDARRIHLGDNLTFLFENAETIRYQILEMVRVERMVREADIRHEIDTYNELIGGSGEIFATLLIEIEDPDKRAKLLAEWVGMPEKIYLGFADGTRAYAIPDIRQNEEAKISSVQFLKFVCGPAVPVTIGVDHSGLKIESALTVQQEEILKKDLS